MRRIIAVLVFGIFVVSCKTVKIRDYEVGNENVINEVRIVQISDFHSNDFGENGANLIEIIKNEKPDIIALTGDFFDERQGDKKCDENASLLLSGISDLCDCYFVTGNHDFVFGDIERKYEIVESHNVNVLHNEVANVNVGNGVVIVAGLEDPYFDFQGNFSSQDENKDAYRERLRQLSEKTAYAKENCEKNGEKFLFSMLLAHRPEYIKDYLN